MSERGCVSTLSRASPKRPRTAAQRRKAAELFAKAFARSAKSVPPWDARLTARVCAPPTSFKRSLLDALRPKRLTVTAVGGRSGKRYRILWTGWEHGCQLIGCRVADALSRDGTAQTVEQSIAVRHFLSVCGTWDDELLHLAEYLPPGGDASALRKQLWDAMSRSFASMPGVGRTVICIPHRSARAELGKTLFAEELPRLRTREYCLLAYDPRRNALTVNPHLASDAAEDVALKAARVRLQLRFHPWRGGETLAALRRYVRRA